MLRYLIIPLLLIFALLPACQRNEETLRRTSGFEEFIPRYNDHIRDWLTTQQSVAREALSLENKKPLPVEKGALDTHLRELKNLRRELSKWTYRLDRGDYFAFATAADVPPDLSWEDGMDLEEIGDSRAIKGGAFRTFIPSFPATLRPFGDNSNNGFRGAIYDSVDMPLVARHPKSMGMIPGIAQQWATSADGRTIYFRLNPEATYSDGSPVKAAHYLFGSYIRISDDIVNPYQKQYWKEEIAGFTVYDDHTLSISVPEARVFAAASLGSLTPSPPHFYENYGPDYTERYQWKFPPTTGPYLVKPDDIVKGVSITQTRVKNWWARDKKYYRYRFNPDQMVHVVVRDESKAFELFRAGQLDTFDLTSPELWYEKSEVDPVFKGYINRYTFYNQYPALPRGMYINVTKPLLSEREIRIGIHHAMNWQKVIDVIFRGDYQRLESYNQGYPGFSDPAIKVRPFSISKARASFRAAGFTKTTRGGILAREDGTKLSVSVSYPFIPLLDRMFAILKEDARKCGLDLRLDSNEPTVDYRKVMQKQHEMSFSAWLVSPPAPDYYQYLHSSNAFDERGNIKPQTNNTFVWAREDTDILTEQARQARTEEELGAATIALQHIVHDEAIFVPAYTVDFTRVGSWRWIEWPDSEETKFSPPIVYRPLDDSFVYWIDPEKKEETLQAKRSGRTFPEVNQIIDAYRSKPSSQEASSQ